MIPEKLVPGLSATLEHTVTDDDTAAAVGSGTLPVLGSPRRRPSGRARGRRSISC